MNNNNTMDEKDMVNESPSPARKRQRTDIKNTDVMRNGSTVLSSNASTVKDENGAGLTLSTNLNFFESLASRHIVKKENAKNELEIQVDLEDDDFFEDKEVPKLHTSTSDTIIKNEQTNNPHSTNLNTSNGIADKLTSTNSTVKDYNKGIYNHNDINDKKDESSEKEEDTEELDKSMLAEPLASDSITATIELARRRAFLSKISAAAKDELWDIQRYDEQGRALTQKEAFRELSHRFHGMLPGIGKRDKRLKRDMKERKQRETTNDVQSKADKLTKITETLQRPFILLNTENV
jgi:hypothetical protein